MHRLQYYCFVYKKTPAEFKAEILTYQGLNLNNGIGTQVNPTVSNKNDFRPQTSDKAPMSGALRNDKNPYKTH